MGQDVRALDKAVESGDTDLVHLVLLHLRRTRPPIEYFRVIKSKPMALDLLLAYSHQQDLKLLRDAYIHLDQPIDLGNTRVIESFLEIDLDKRIVILEDALQLYTQGKV
jgi:hypothetical protein